MWDTLCIYLVYYYSGYRARMVFVSMQYLKIFCHEMKIPKVNQYVLVLFHSILQKFKSVQCCRNIHNNVNIWHVYGSCQRLQVFHVLLDCGGLCHLQYQQWEVYFSCFYSVLIGISFFTNLGQPVTKYCNSLVMWIPFMKAKPKEKQGVKMI